MLTTFPVDIVGFSPGNLCLLSFTNTDSRILGRAVCWDISLDVCCCQPAYDALLLRLRPAGDSMRHYASVPGVARLVRTRLRLALAPFEERLGVFVLLSRRSDTSLLVLCALCPIATFLATNAFRHGWEAVACDAWVQAVTAAAGSVSPLQRMCIMLWYSPPLPA